MSDECLIRQKLRRFINRYKTPATDDLLWNPLLECCCPLCNAFTQMDTNAGLPICVECGWVNFKYLDSTPEWKSIKSQQEESVGLSVLQLQTYGPGSAAASRLGVQSFYGGSYSSSGSSSSIKAVSPSTITSVALSSFIEKKKFPERAPDETKRTDSSSIVRPPRRKKVRFNPSEKVDEEESSALKDNFRPSINSRTFFDHCQHMYQVAAERRIGKLMIDRAIWWYKELLQFYKFHGFVCDALKSASVYMSAIEFKIPYTQKDCADMFAVSKSYTTKCINLMEKHRTTIMIKSTCNKPSDYLRLFFSKLRESTSATTFPIEHLVLCFFVAERLEKLQLAMDNYPHCVAATVVFMVIEAVHPNPPANWKKTICTLSQTSEVTLNRCFNKLIVYKEDLFPPVSMTGMV